jgi:hypothetical protein
LRFEDEPGTQALYQRPGLREVARHGAGNTKIAVRVSLRRGDTVKDLIRGA